jgi:hypothetical protein
MLLLMSQNEIETETLISLKEEKLCSVATE